LQTLAWKSRICLKNTFSEHCRTVLSLLPHPGHPVSLSCLVWPVISAWPDQLDFAVLSLCPVPAVMFSLSSPGRIIPTVLSWLSCPSCAFQVELPQHSFPNSSILAVLTLLPVPDCPVLAVLSQLSCLLSCPGSLGGPYIADQKWKINDKSKKEYLVSSPERRVGSWLIENPI
jgi:hypothetical protein